MIVARGYLDRFRSWGITNCSRPLVALVEVKAGRIWVDVEEAVLFLPFWGGAFWVLSGCGHSFMYITGLETGCRTSTRRGLGT
jgi:hypothetical protein